MNYKRNSIVNILLTVIVLSSLFNSRTVQAQDTLPKTIEPIKVGIYGRITDGSGNGIEGVSVLAVQDNYRVFIPAIISSSGLTTPPNPPSTDRNFYTVQTDIGGYYVLSDVPAGRYRLSASKMGLDFNPLSYTVSTTDAKGEYNFQSVIVPTIYTSTTHNLSDATIAHLISISEDGAEFTFDTVTTELSAVDVGEVIIGGISGIAPQGFLRKVTSKQTSGSNLILVTEQAAFEEAFESLSVQMTRQLTPADMKDFPDVPGVKLVLPPDGQKAESFSFELVNAVVYDIDNNLSTTDDQVVTSGSLIVSPTIELRIRSEGTDIKEFYLKTTWNVQADLTVSSNISLILKKETKLIPNGIALGDYPIGPVVISPHLDLVAAISGELYAGVSATITNTSTFTKGMHCVEWDCQDLSSFQTDFDFLPVNFTNGVAFTFFVGPKLSFKLWKIVGPYVRAGVVLKLDIAPALNPWLTLKGGIEASVGASVEVPFIRKELVKVSLPPIGLYLLLMARHKPNIPTNPSPPNGSTGKSLTSQLSWTGGDVDGDSVTYDVYFEANDSTPDVLISNDQSGTAFNPGTLVGSTKYYWQVVAKDWTGMTSTSPVWNFTTISNATTYDFTGTLAPWVAVSGTWTPYPSYVFTPGIYNQISSIYLPTQYGNLDFSVRVKRDGCVTCANRVMIHGAPYPLSTMKAWSSDLMFQYTSNGYYSVWKVVNGTETNLAQWATSSAVITGANWNVLRVTASGSTYKFYINGTLVWSGTDTSLPSGQVGIGMYTNLTTDKFYVDWAKFQPTSKDGPDSDDDAPQIPDDIGTPVDGNENEVFRP